MERVSDLPFCRRFEGFHRWPQRFLWAKYVGKLRPNRRSPAGVGNGAQTIRCPVRHGAARQCTGGRASTERGLEAYLFGSSRCSLRKDKLNMPAAMMLVLIVLVSLAAWSGLRTRRIRNSITGTGAPAGALSPAFYPSGTGSGQT